jgi:two-component system sensor histidine kinase KdpD
MAIAEKSSFRHGLPAQPRLAYLWALLACGTTTLVTQPLLPYIDPVNIVMIFLLTVALVALRLGSGPAALAAVTSVALFDFFFVPPRFSWAVADVQYLLTFAVMLAVALLIGQLTARLRQRAEEAQERERRTQALYELTRELAGVIDASQVTDAIGRSLADDPQLEVALVVGSRGEAPTTYGGGDWLSLPVALTVMDRAEILRVDVLPHARAACLYLPLVAPMQVRGTLAVMAADGGVLDGLRPLLENMASLAAIAVERLHYAKVARDTEVKMMAERLRASILSALSHDLRTPLTALVGMADALTRARPPLPERQAESAAALRDQGLRLSRMVANLLDMARLQAGEARLRKDWQPVEEVIGASIKLLEGSLGGHVVKVELAPDLPLLEFDAVLMERVFWNLIENAAKYAPTGTVIDIAVMRDGDMASIAVCDRGPGISVARRERIFDLFVRGDAESALPGVGLGLAICRTIVEAHGGVIAASDRPGGGACFRFTLPLGEPPQVEPEEEPADD